MPVITIVVFSPGVRPFVMRGVLQRLRTYSWSKRWVWYSGPRLSRDGGKQAELLSPSRLRRLGGAGGKVRMLSSSFGGKEAGSENAGNEGTFQG